MPAWDYKDLMGNIVSKEQQYPDSPHPILRKPHYMVRMLEKSFSHDKDLVPMERIVQEQRRGKKLDATFRQKSPFVGLGFGDPEAERISQECDGYYISCSEGFALVPGAVFPIPTIHLRKAKQTGDRYETIK